MDASRRVDVQDPSLYPRHAPWSTGLIDLQFSHWTHVTFKQGDLEVEHYSGCALHMGQASPEPHSAPPSRSGVELPNGPKDIPGSQSCCQTNSPTQYRHVTDAYYRAEMGDIVLSTWRGVCGGVTSQTGQVGARSRATLSRHWFSDLPNSRPLPVSVGQGFQTEARPHSSHLRKAR
jgi:hypothetical protein